MSLVKKAREPNVIVPLVCTSPTIYSPLSPAQTILFVAESNVIEAQSESLDAVKGIWPPKTMLSCDTLPTLNPPSFLSAVLLAYITTLSASGSITDWIFCVKNEEETRPPDLSLATGIKVLVALPSSVTLTDTSEPVRSASISARTTSV